MPNKGCGKSLGFKAEQFRTGNMVDVLCGQVVSGWDENNPSILLCDECKSSKPSLNNDFNKQCHKCDGKGEVKKAIKDIDGYDLEDCLYCNGHGFIKS